jgi:hypothetical protein
MGAGVSGGMGAGVNGGAMGTEGPSTGIETRTDARINSQGPSHASERALDRANQNSVLSGGTTTTASLSDLRTGLTVKDSSGATLGTISRINRSAGGTVRNVLVRTASGKRRTISLAPDSLSFDGSVVTTTRLANSHGRR